MTDKASKLTFRPLALEDRACIQQHTFESGLQNCNYSFINLISWQPTFGTEFALTSQGLVLRYRSEGGTAYMLNLKQHDADAYASLAQALCDDARQHGERLVVMGLENRDAEGLASALGTEAQFQTLRNNQDYIYDRSRLESLQGKELHGKRNHVNKFRSLYPHYTYRPLEQSLFPLCIELEKRWREAGHNRPEGYAIDTIDVEQRNMQYVFDHWTTLDAIGGAVLVDEKLVAFTYGGAITEDTFDVCVEKADVSYEGAFNIINQEFVRHLPPQFVHINREEDMGLEGLRKAKTAYHPQQLLEYNILTYKLKHD